jgi:hypothetical protein
MKSLTRSLLVTAAVAASTFSLVSAQTPPPAPSDATAPAAAPTDRLQARVDHRVHKLTKSLALSDAQQVQVKSILLAEAYQTKTIFENKSLSRDDRHTQVQALHEATLPKLEAVMTPDQKAKLDAMIRHEQDRVAAVGAPKQ